MATATIYATRPNSGYVGANESSYSACRNADSPYFVNPDPATHIGPYTNHYPSSSRLYESAWEFDLTALPSNIVVDSVALEADQTNGSPGGIPEVRVRPETTRFASFASTWIKPTTLSGYSLFANTPSTPIDGMIYFDVKAAAIQAVQDAAAGYLNLNISSNYHRTGNSSEHRQDWAPHTIKLTVEYRIVNPPNAPSLNFPVNNEVINADNTNRFDWDFDDPDPGDTQSAYELRYRIAGTSTWTTLSGSTPNTYRDIGGGTFVDDAEYEWQVRTADSDDMWGDWSSSGFFNAHVPPNVPTIADPIAGQTIPTEEYDVEWSSSEQSAFQVRRVADDAGSPDTSTVYEDSGVVEEASTRSYTLTFSTNNRDEHVQVRTREHGLWSDWATVRVVVDYETPAVPIIDTDEQDAEGRIVISISNPTPVGDEPYVLAQDVERRHAGEQAWERIAKDLGEGDSYEDYTPASGQSYEYRVRSYGNNGTSTYSETSLSPGIILVGSWLHDPLDAEDSIHRFRYNAEGGTDTWEPELELRRFAGRTLPVAEYGEGESLSIALALALDVDEVPVLRELAARKTPLCYRDKAGRKAFVVVPSLPVTHRLYGGDSSVELIAINYSEEV